MTSFFLILVLVTVCNCELVNVGRTLGFHVLNNWRWPTPIEPIWRQGQIDTLKELSAIYMRMDLSWNDVEKEKGVYDFSKYDLYVDEAIANGFVPLFLVFSSNNLAGHILYDEGLSPHTAEGRNAYSDFFFECVKRYEGKGIIWELWNEPNLHWFWTPTPNDEDFCIMANEVIDRIHGAYPNETIVGPALAGEIGVDGALDYLTKTFECGLLDKFDMISLHPYNCWNYPEMYYEMHDLIIQEMNKYGITKPLINTEWAYSDFDLPDDVPMEKDVYLQALYLTRMKLTTAAHYMKISIWFLLSDSGRNPFQWIDSVGVTYSGYSETRPHFEIKPTYYAYQAFTTLLDGFYFDKRIVVDKDENFVLQFSTLNNESYIFAVYTRLNEEQIIEFDIGKSSICFTEIYTHLGLKVDGEECSDETGIVSVSSVFNNVLFYVYGKNFTKVTDYDGEYMWENKSLRQILLENYKLIIVTFILFIVICCCISVLLILGGIFLAIFFVLKRNRVSKDLEMNNNNTG